MLPEECQSSDEAFSTEWPRKRMDKDKKVRVISEHLDDMVRVVLASKADSSPDAMIKKYSQELCDHFRSFAIYFRLDSEICAHFYLQLSNAELESVDFSGLPITIELLNSFLERHPNLKKINAADCSKLVKFGDEAVSNYSHQIQGKKAKFLALLYRNKCLTSLHLDLRFAASIYWSLRELGLDDLTIKMDGQNKESTFSTSTSRLRIASVGMFKKLFTAKSSEREAPSKLLDEKEGESGAKLEHATARELVLIAMASKSPTFIEELVDKLSPKLIDDFVEELRRYIIKNKLRSKKCISLYNQLGNATLTKINFSGMPISLQFLIEFLWHHPDLEEIDISNCSKIDRFVHILTFIDKSKHGWFFAAFGAAIARNKSLKALRLDIRLANTMYQTLTELNLEKLHIRKNNSTWLIKSNEKPKHFYLFRASALIDSLADVQVDNRDVVVKCQMTRRVN